MSRDQEFRDPNPTCSFCGRSSHDVQIMIQGPMVNICNECVEASAQIVRRNLNQNRRLPIDRMVTPREIKDKLDEYVIGQERAKRTLAVSVYNHYKRIRSQASETMNKDVELSKSNILLIGPTGPAAFCALTRAG